MQQKNETSPPSSDVRAAEDTAHVVDFLSAIFHRPGVSAATLFLAPARVGKHRAGSILSRRQEEFGDRPRTGLLTLHDRTSQAGVALHLDHRPQFLDRVLQVTGLFDHFDLARSDAEIGDPRLSQASSGEPGARQGYGCGFRRP